jgi:hypothetical protein
MIVDLGMWSARGLRGAAPKIVDSFALFSFLLDLGPMT